MGARGALLLALLLALAGLGKPGELGALLAGRGQGAMGRTGGGGRGELTSCLLQSQTRRICRQVGRPGCAMSARAVGPRCTGAGGGEGGLYCSLGPAPGIENSVGVESN